MKFNWMKFILPPEFGVLGGLLMALPSLLATGAGIFTSERTLDHQKDLAEQQKRAQEEAMRKERRERMRQKQADAIVAARESYLGNQAMTRRNRRNRTGGSVGLGAQGSLSAVGAAQKAAGGFSGGMYG